MISIKISLSANDMAKQDAAPASEPNMIIENGFTLSPIKPLIN